MAKAALVVLVLMETLDRRVHHRAKPAPVELARLAQRVRRVPQQLRQRRVQMVLTVLLLATVRTELQTEPTASRKWVLAERQEQAPTAATEVTVSNQ